MTNLTLGGLLSWLHQTSKPYMRSQISFFGGLFASYCARMSASYGYDWQPNQSVISKMLHDQASPPWHLRQYYICNGASRLRNDVCHYLEIVAPTAMLRDRYLTHLLAAVQGSANIHPEDKTYIMQYSESDNGQPLTELLCRTLYILLTY